MGIFRFLNRLFKLDTPNEIDALDKKCNTTFESVFDKCKAEFGREMIELMNLKRNLMENIMAPGDCTPLQIMITIKTFMLLEMYFNLAESYIVLKDSVTHDQEDLTITSFINNTKDQMVRIYDLISLLNIQFYLDSDRINPNECDKILDEVEKLFKDFKED